MWPACEPLLHMLGLHGTARPPYSRPHLPRQWDYNPELYPMGGEAFVSAMGNASFTYYTNGFDANNSYRHAYNMVGRGEMEPHPNASLHMYSDIIGNASSRYNMEMLFTDFLCYRGPSMGQYQDVAEGEEGEHLWLSGQARGAEVHGVEVQFCMALAHQILMSAEWPAVTNCRVNGDGGLMVQDIVLPSLLAAAVGLGWSKDNLRTADRYRVVGVAWVPLCCALPCPDDCEMCQPRTHTAGATTPGYTPMVL